MADTKSKAGRKPGQSTVAPELTGISTAIEMPAPPARSNRGSKSAYPFDQLEVGASFGVKNKTREQMQSIVSNQNKKHRTEKRDEAGNVVYQTTEAKDVDGNVTHLPTDKPEMVDGKMFFAIEADPKKDPDGAKVRVFRNK